MVISPEQTRMFRGIYDRIDRFCVQHQIYNHVSWGVNKIIDFHNLDKHIVTINVYDPSRGYVNRKNIASNMFVAGFWAGFFAGPNDIVHYIDEPIIMLGVNTIMGIVVGCGSFLIGLFEEEVLYNNEINLGICRYLYTVLRFTTFSRFIGFVSAPITRLINGQSKPESIFNFKKFNNETTHITNNPTYIVDSKPYKIDNIDDITGFSINISDEGISMSFKEK